MLTKERADDLRNLPLQDCDVLLHEAGAPPIHTPLWVLKELPDHVKRRLYVVHTSALPPDSELRVAPTGTAGTIRFDELGVNALKDPNASHDITNGTANNLAMHGSFSKFVLGVDPESLDDGGYPNLTVHGSYIAPDRNIICKQVGPKQVPPLAFLRPTCVSDAWFILNLLSAVPFLSRYFANSVYLSWLVGRLLLLFLFVFEFAACRTPTQWRCSKLHKSKCFVQTMLSFRLVVAVRFYVSSGKGHALKGTQSPQMRNIPFTTV